ncbi:hypothetical protein [Winogradskyella marincola]|uniref:Glycine dehydrogenase n=1 Tax=Winogradskyella marincola TaxID=3037795 RepID=A0ABT6G4B5_9FLAO|nr:hypothetical protein [Winogradskyella sp. YYF002]MDG4716887.1 hypothetical protein [Winogradskyella sp. YYF002]
MKKNFLFISCEEAKHICDKSQYGEATGWERIKLTIRLTWCRVTKAYSKKNSKLSDVIEHAEVDCLKKDERNKLKKQFEEELEKHQ